MAALRSRCGHYIFVRFLSSFFFFFSSPNLTQTGCLPYFYTWCGLSANLMQVWNMMHAARWKYRTQKNDAKIAISAASHKFVGLYLRNSRHISTMGKIC